MGNKGEAFSEKPPPPDDALARVLSFAQSVGPPAETGAVRGAAAVLLELGLDADAAIAALLRERFRDRAWPEAAAGPAAVALARGAGKIDGLRTDVKTAREAEDARSMVFALTDDVRVVVVKIAEKLARLRALDSAGAPTDAGERKAAARECLDVYAPLAGRLGISRIKDEMEDLSLKFLNRETYGQIKSLVAQKREGRGLFLDLAREAITREAEKAGLEIETQSRAKHFYSVYLKMRKRGKSADEIRDLSGVRAICACVEDCYTLLGIVHRLWRPVDGSFKDYVARPKPNGYSSLHTTVEIEGADDDGEKDGKGRPLEIQIRTREMHRVAEYGVASHWIYKKGPARNAATERDVDAANRLRDWKRGEEAEGAGAWLAGIKRELFGKWVFVFTPQGKAIRLPAGSTPVDFAFRIHTAIGESCLAAKADGAIVPLDSRLENARVVEILTGPSARPSRNWLQFVKSGKARGRIRSWLEKNAESGAAEKNAAEKRRAAAEPPPAPEPAAAAPALTVIRPLSSAMRARVDDEKNTMVRFARCCGPVPGDPILGYVSRGRGVIIHRENCPEAARNPEFEKRRLKADWENPGSALVKRFGVEARLSVNLFSEIEGAIRKRQGHLIEGRVEETAGNRLSGSFVMQLARAEDLKAVMKNVRGIPGVLAIRPID